MDKKSKGLKVLALIVVFIVFILGIILFLATRNIDFDKDISASLQNIIIKVVKSCISDKEVEITQCEINSVVNSMASNYEFNHDLTINGVYVNLNKDDNIKIYVPINYRGVNALLSMNAYASIVNDNIAIYISNLKLGKLPIPTHVIMDILSCVFSDKIIIDGNVLYFDSKIPINIFNKTIDLKINKIL